MDTYENLILNENWPIAIVQGFIIDFAIAAVGAYIFWMIVRRRNNSSANPATFFLQVFGLQEPEGDRYQFKVNLPD